MNAYSLYHQVYFTIRAIIDDIINLSCHEQECLMRLRFVRYFARILLNFTRMASWQVKMFLRLVLDGLMDLAMYICFFVK